MEIIATPQDALYLSWHSPNRVAAPENLPRLLPAKSCYRGLNELNRLLVRLGFAVVPFEGVPTGRYGWPVLPEALTDALAGLTEFYGRRLPPVRIVDNGMCDVDSRAAQRRALLAGRLGWLGRVMAQGVTVRGYEYWSIMDNLDWIRRYARLYSISVPTASGTVPAAPRDWARSGWFGRDTANPAAAGRALRVV